MNRTLHEADNAQRILKLTADTMLLVDRNGICIDIDIHSNLWFLQEERLLGKNIFERMPEHTREKVYSTFQTVLREQRSISKNYKLELEDNTYYFKCIMYPYDDMVLCQYRDITQRSNVKRQLEQVNRNLREIQKVAQIGQWMYNTRDNVFYYMGYTGVLCEESSRSISLEKYQEFIVEEDRLSFTNWCRKNEEGLNEDSISYRVRVAGEIYYMRLQAYLRDELPNGSCNIEGYIQNITDIQRRRNDINTLTHAINNAKESIFAAKEDGTLIFANRQFLHNHGIPESEEIGKLKIYEIAGDMNTQEDWHERCKDILHGGSRSFVAHHPSKVSKNILAYEGIMYNVTNDSGEESYWSFSHDISERLHYEAQIKRLNLIMDTTIDNLPAGIVVKEINNDFRYIYRNRESYNRNLCIGESIGKNDFDYYPPEVAEKKREEDTLVATTGRGLHWTTEGKDKNGNEIILDKRKIRVDGDELSSPIIVSIEWDITELEKIKRELQTSKEKAEMSDKLKSAFLANMSHEIRTPLNAIVGFSHLIAESENKEERKTFYEIVEANNERLLQLINEILDLSKIESGIIEFTSAPVNIHSLCKEVHDAHVFRTPQGVQLIYEPSENGLVIETDKNRVFQVFSNLIGNAFKFTKAGSISYGYKLVGNQIVFHVTDTGTGIEPEKIILDKRKIRVDGDELSSPIIVSIEWDITELEKIKRELQTSKEKAEMSDKLKSAFLANMSHEIRTPLNAIVGFSHLIAESENKEERKTFYEIVEANNERLLQLINEILDLSKIESGIIEFTSAPVNIHSLCKEVHDAHVFRTPQGVQLIYEPSENGLVIETDKNRVFQVFSNLIGNAFKFTKAGSISYGYKLVGNQIVFHVTDTGTGIEPEKIERVFERFAKLNNYAQGTGLGLSICKTIIERLGGEISVSSVVGQGTTFTFTLPYESDQSTENTKEEKRQEGNANENPTGTGSMKIDPASTETPAETSVKEDSEKTSGNTDDNSSDSISANASPSQRTILIAEDEDSNFDLLKAILGRKYRLIRARDGMEAVTSYDEAKPDLILMDIKMPNLDGLEATKIIRELSPTVPIIAQSAYAYQQDQIAATDAGCSDFIAKPISQAKLKDMINKWLP